MAPFGLGAEGDELSPGATAFPVKSHSHHCRLRLSWGGICICQFHNVEYVWNMCDLLPCAPNRLSLSPFGVRRGLAHEP